MLKIRKTHLGWLAVCLSLFLAACATQSKEDLQATVNSAEVTLNNFRNDPDMGWFRDNVKNARAIVVSPQVIQAGFVFGGSTGRAVAFARGPAGQEWAGPAFYRISSGTFGLQAGGQASEVVIMAMSERALNSLMSNSFKLGGDMSIAAGPVGAGAGRAITSDFVVFSRSRGLFGGLNLEGTAITLSDTDNASYYGRSVTPVDILIKRTVSQPAASSIRKTITAIAR